MQIATLRDAKVPALPVLTVDTSPLHLPGTVTPEVLQSTELTWWQTVVCLVLLVAPWQILKRPLTLLSTGPLVVQLEALNRRAFPNTRRLKQRVRFAALVGLPPLLIPMVTQARTWGVLPPMSTQIPSLPLSAQTWAPNGLFVIALHPHPE